MKGEDKADREEARPAGTDVTELEERLRHAGRPAWQGVDFSSLRAGVMHRLEGSRGAAPSFRRLQSWNRRFQLAAAASVLLALALGFFGGLRVGRSGLEERLVHAFRHQAGDNDGTRGDTAVLASNIRLRHVPGGLALSFDLGTEIQLVGAPEDPLVREVLREAVRGGADDATRLAAVVALTGALNSLEQLDSASISALQGASRTDPNSMIRAEALSALLREEGWRPPRAFLEERLAADDALGVRWLAYEELRRRGEEPDRPLTADRPSERGQREESHL